MSGERVLVTGGTGFIGSHAIVQLLAAGYRVRTTVRNLSRADDVRALAAAGAASTGLKIPTETIEVVAADLLSDEGWAEAVADCTYVLHVASPFPVTQPKDENELIIPAREGALRVLRAARDAGVARVVLTSSFAAVGYSPEDARRRLHRGRLDRPEHARHHRLRQVEDPVRARRVGLRGTRGQRASNSPSSTRSASSARRGAPTSRPRSS